MEPREGTGCWYSYMRYAATNGAQTLVSIRHEKQMPIIISPFKDGPTLHGLTLHHSQQCTEHGERDLQSANYCAAVCVARHLNLHQPF